MNEFLNPEQNSSYSPNLNNSTPQNLNPSPSPSTQNPKEAFGAVSPSTPKQEQKNTHTQHKSHLTSLALIVLLLVSGLGVHKVYLQNKLQEDLTKVEQVIEAQKTNQVIQDNQEVSLGLKKAFLEKQRDEQIFWSNVLVRFNELMKNNNNISNSSFSGNEAGNLAFAAKTKSNSNDPYLDTALLIEKFKASSSFDGIFIPSISSTVSESGEETLTYNVRTDYLKNEIDTELIEDIDTSTEESTIEVDPAEVEDLADSLRGQIENPTESTPETPEPTEESTTETTTDPELSNPTE